MKGKMSQKLKELKGIEVFLIFELGLLGIELYLKSQRGIVFYIWNGVE